MVSGVEVDSGLPPLEAAYHWMVVPEVVARFATIGLAVAEIRHSSKRRARETAEGLARRTEHVDLSTDAAFHRAFAEAMIFPE